MISDAVKRQKAASVSVVGVLWSAFGPAVAFSYSAVLFTLGVLLVVRLR